MKDLGRGIATLGIWIGVGMCGLGAEPAAAMPVALAAMLGTLFVWGGAGNG